MARLKRQWSPGWVYAGLLFLAVLILVGGWGMMRLNQKKASGFDGRRALADASYQMSLGPRVAGSAAHDQVVAWLQVELAKAGWRVEIQTAEMLGHPIKNVVAKRGKGSPWIILGAHYDSRIFADRDPDLAKRSQPVPGANDGASGVAVLLELARSLPDDLAKQIWLVFFDAEDNGDIAGWNWILGSRAFAAQLIGQPDAVVVVDMIGDANLDINIEKNSDQALSKKIWAQAAAAGYSKNFIPQDRYALLDDHLPFLEKGIPAVDIIDFNYPYWHTTQDTLDKISADSLQAVGETLFDWLVKPLP